MYNSPLEEFLDKTALQTNPDYVANLLKTAYSKNITIEEWNTFIYQFRELISRDADTYSGFEKVLEDLRLKLDQDFSVTDNPKAYVKTPKGTQTTLDISATGMPGAIMSLDGAGQSIIASEPTVDTHIANKKYVDTVASGKPNKLTPSKTYPLVYVKDTDGKDIGIAASSVSNSNHIIIRDGSGRAHINAPLGNTQIANKQYVDNKIANAIDDVVTKFGFIEVVDTLPEEGLSNKIYFVPKADAQNKDLFDEYLWVNGAWEWIGTKQLELDIDEDELNAIIGEVLA